MDIKRIFDSLRPWSRGLDKDQASVLARFMVVADAKGFADFQVEEMRRIQEQLLRSDEDPGRQSEMKGATRHLSPAVSGTCFI